MRMSRIDCELARPVPTVTTSSYRVDSSLEIATKPILWYGTSTAHVSHSGLSDCQCSQSLSALSKSFRATTAQPPQSALFAKVLFSYFSFCGDESIPSLSRFFLALRWHSQGMGHWIHRAVTLCSLRDPVTESPALVPLT